MADKGEGNSSAAAARSVGVIGLGQMGRGIAANLDRAGLLLAAYDITPEAFGRVGLSPQVGNAPPEDIGRICDTVFFVVPASPQIPLSATGEGGVLASARPGQVLVDLTTSYPSDTRRLAAIAEEAGRSYLDCGMTGGAAGAAAGTMTLMVGGEADVVERVRPVLERIAGKVFHVGPSGAGHTLKLIHNMVLHTVFFATSEGCRAAERAGLDLAKVIEVFNAGNARSFITEVRFPRHILSGKFDGQSYVSTLAKDLGMAARYVEEIGAPALYGPLTSRLLDRAVAAGMGKDDFTLIYSALEALLAAEAAEEPRSAQHA
jgi:3-hydroxyisobutyrate dehydrogenase